MATNDDTRGKYGLDGPLSAEMVGLEGLLATIQRKCSATSTSSDDSRGICRFLKSQLRATSGATSSQVHAQRRRGPSGPSSCSCAFRTARKVRPTGRFQNPGRRIALDSLTGLIYHEGCPDGG